MILENRLVGDWCLVLRSYFCPNYLVSFAPSLYFFYSIKKSLLEEMCGSQSKLWGFPQQSEWDFFTQHNYFFLTIFLFNPLSIVLCIRNYDAMFLQIQTLKFAWPQLRCFIPCLPSPSAEFHHVTDVFVIVQAWPWLRGSLVHLLTVVPGVTNGFQGLLSVVRPRPLPRQLVAVLRTERMDTTVKDFSPFTKRSTLLFRSVFLATNESVAVHTGGQLRRRWILSKITSLHLIWYRARNPRCRRLYSPTLCIQLHRACLSIHIYGLHGLSLCWNFIGLALGAPHPPSPNGVDIVPPSWTQPLKLPAHHPGDPAGDHRPAVPASSRHLLQCGVGPLRRRRRLLLFLICRPRSPTSAHFFFRLRDFFLGSGFTKNSFDFFSLARLQTGVTSHGLMSPQ